MSKFTVKYFVSDGSALEHELSFSLDSGEIDIFMDDDDLKAKFHDMIDDHFRQSVAPYSIQEDDFVSWAKEQITNRS